MWKQIVEGFLQALLAFLDKKASAPRTIEDANTPQTIRDRWAAYLRERLRALSDKDGGAGQSK
jgi:hypothetical protein